ncbi:TlpA family protein disulfide reductase [Pedobacter immunditicola]|uniref:TlpA family protein disulfide reductase n=1 Tax=Pedobacter immunditicola TaxID=3133440 RepID=UPI0030AB455A
MKTLLIGFVLTLCSFTMMAQSPATFMPAFKFYTAKNTGFTKAQVPIGKSSLVVFFDGTCGHCQKVMTMLSARNKELQNVNVYLVSMDEFRTINYFMDNYGSALKGMKNVMLLQDRDQIFIPLFKPTKYPAMFVYGADQRLRIYSSDEKDIPKILSMLKS